MSGRAGTVSGATGNPGPMVPQEHRSGAGPAFQTREGPPVPTSAHWPLRSHLALGALPGAVPSARLHTRQVLWEWTIQPLTEPVELIVSELVTNAIQASAGLTRSRYRGRWAAGTPPVRLWLCSDRSRVLVQVWDGNDEKPERKDPAPDAPGGRGLLLIEALSAAWGAYRPDGSTGKAVWAIVETT